MIARLCPSLLCLLLAGAAAQAAPITIVALGADNVAGTGLGMHAGGVPASAAFPAQLQALLRARGTEAVVVNAGVPGDTCPDILARLDSAVPGGTQMVIFDRPNGNDRKAGRKGRQGECLSELDDRLSARHIPLLVLPRWDDIPGAIENRDPDGHHFTAQGHAQIAAYLLPKVLEMLPQQP